MSKRAVVITGANGNIGSNLAEKLINRYDYLILMYHNNQHRIKSLAERYPDKISLLQADLKDYTNMEQQIESVLTEQNISPYALIHTAAMRSIDHKALSETDEFSWEEVIEVNIKGTYNILKCLIRCFKKDTNRAKDSVRHIVLLGSEVSKTGLPYGSAYGSAKAAIANIGKSLAVELGEDNILINTVSPGPVEIDDSHFSEDYRQFRADYYEQVKKHIPLGRLAQIDDVVELITFLISESNRYMSGQELFLTGGK